VNYSQEPVQPECATDNCDKQCHTPIASDSASFERRDGPTDHSLYMM